ncbi:MAG: isoprenylcysteine carboxylmethyltransferase family protein [Acidobacteria bacterium]|nr:isoprenylcysteine carboxylmethyltransferase family protein [Acidobacteriota bacterium]
MNSVLLRLARLRVPLGFGAAAAAYVLARPNASSLLWGMLVAAAGEAVRLWAAGHLEKGREVTRSGPYRFSRHPLYVGSTVIACGVTLAASSVWVAAVTAVYLAATLTAAVRTEEAYLRRQFGQEYDNYCQGLAASVDRRFSWTRAWRNREWRAIAGLAVAAALLAAKAAWLN